MSKRNKNRNKSHRSENQQAVKAELEQPTKAVDSDDEQRSTEVNPSEVDQTEVNSVEAEQGSADSESPPVVEEQDGNGRQVIVKKSSSPLALLLSLLALCACAYLYYLNQLATEDKYGQQINDLNRQNQGFEQQLTQLEKQSAVQLQKLQQQLQQQAATIAQLQKAKAPTAIDPKQLDRFVEQTELTGLQQQLTKQQQTIAQLQTQWETNKNAVQQPTEQDQGQQTLLLDELLHTNQIISKLYLTKSLVQAGAFKQAQELLVQTAQDMPSSVKTEAEQLLQTWQSIQQPKLKPIQKQLNQAKKLASQLSLQTDKSTATEQTEKEAWYNRFISIKKIDKKNNLENSNQLQLLKIQLTQSLLQAEWSLNLQQQPSWQRQLNHAANLLLEKMPYEQQLQQQLRALAEQQIAANPLPSKPLEQIIEQLKSVTP